MNTANKLTILRVALIPVFMACLLYDFGGYLLWHNWAAAGIFVIASFTDWLDGHIARKYGQVTDFGKIVDPLADKMLVTAALVGLTALGMVSPWVVVIILAREFTITGIRIAAASGGVVIAASWWGKVKTTLQMLAIIVALLLFRENSIITAVLMWGAAAVTLLSGIEYIVKNVRFLSMK